MTHAGNFFPLADCEKSTHGKIQAIDREVTQGKPGVASMACAAKNLSKENPA